MSSDFTRPFWLDTTVGPVFAWHHAASGDARGAAVVLCKPFGYEAACCHRAYRHLARRLAHEGFHVLSIDYHGTGDSSGSDADGDRLSAWLESLHVGAAWIRANLGVERIVLVGTRFGALLALEAAARRDADALVLFAPPPSARAWLREIRAGRRLRGDSRRQNSDGGEESAGFLLTGATVQDLEQLGLGPTRRAATKVLVIARDDLPGNEERLASDLESRGAEVTLSRAPGYAAMMQDDPHKSIVPGAVWEEIVRWLASQYEPSPSAPSAPEWPRVARVRERDEGPWVREEAVDIEGLFGILTEPVDTQAAVQAPFVLLHNVGANPHIGSNRMYVTLARRWAALGHRVLRFDSAGLGDSPADDRVAENRVYADSAIDDSRHAMDFLARHRGAERFILMGLCSGAYVSYRAALADTRVAGVILMNILVFQWKEGDSIDIRKREAVNSVHFYWHTAFKLESWGRLLRGELNLRTITEGLLQKMRTRARLRIQQVRGGESDVARNLRALMRRNVEVLFVFAEEDGGRDEIDAHFGTDGERFRHHPQFRFEVIDGTDHTFSPLWSHERIFSLLTNYLSGRFVRAEPRLP